MNLNIVRNPEDFQKRILLMQQRKKVCDAEVIIEEKVSVHSVILAASSEFFEQRLVEQNCNKITIQNLDSASVKSLIEYCYSGKININHQNWKNILNVANFLIMPEVIQGCCRFAKMWMNIDNCVETWKLAKEQNVHDLENASFDYLCAYFEKATETEEFLNLDHQDMIELLEADLNVSSETVVLSSVERWINKDVSNRVGKLGELLKRVKLLHIPHKILLENFQSLCNLDLQCHVMILNSIRWQTVETKPKVDNKDIQPRLPHSAVVVLGGNTTPQANTIEIYDHKTKTWRALPEVKFKAIDYGCVLYEEKFIMVGGREGNGGIITSTYVESYDPKTKLLTMMPPLLQSRWLHCVVKYEKYIYAIGGRISIGDEKLVNDIERWDPVSNKWTHVTKMDKIRDSFKAAVLGNEIYIVGGCYKGVDFKDMIAYNPETGKWRKCEDMNSPRFAFGVIAFGGYLYAVGGHHAVQLKSVEKYDPITDKWTSIQDFDTPQAWVGGGDCFGDLMVIGGYSNKYNSTVQIYNQAENKWTSVGDINVARSNHRVLNVPWKLIQ